MTEVTERQVSGVRPQENRWSFRSDSPNTYLGPETCVSANCALPAQVLT